MGASEESVFLVEKRGSYERVYREAAPQLHHSAAGGSTQGTGEGTRGCTLLLLSLVLLYTLVERLQVQG